MLKERATHKWDQFLNQALFTCRIRTHAITKQNTFYLVYGRHPNLPTSTFPQIIWDKNDENDKRELIARQMEELGHARLAVFL